MWARQKLCVVALPTKNPRLQDGLAVTVGVAVGDLLGVAVDVAVGTGVKVRVRVGVLLGVPGRAGESVGLALTDANVNAVATAKTAQIADRKRIDSPCWFITTPAEGASSGVWTPARNEARSSRQAMPEPFQVRR
jgi:hypothetical protein